MESRRSAATLSSNSWTIKDFNLPLLEEPVPAIRGQHSKPHTKARADMLDRARGAMVQSRPGGAKLAEIAKIIDPGQLAPVINRILPLSEARRAHELSQSGHAYGKIVLEFGTETGAQIRTMIEPERNTKCYPTIRN